MLRWCRPSSMPDGLRIRLRNSPRLRMLQRAIRLLLIFCLFNGVLASQISMVPAALGLWLVARSLSRMDPQGLTLLKGDLGQPGGLWFVVYPDGREDEDHRRRLCCLHSQGSFSSLLWLEVHESSCAEKRSTYRSFLIFPDALSFEHWRLLRRELRLEDHTGDAVAR